MGCCGCSLAASTVTAVVLGLVESVVGMVWNILVIVVIETHRNINGDTTDNNYTTTVTTADGDVQYDGDQLINSSSRSITNESDWEQLKLTLVSEEATLHAHVFELSIASLVLNTIWLITTLALAVGNSEKCRNMLKPWVVTTALITVSDIAATIYFIFKAIKTYGEDIDTAVIHHRLFVENIYVLLATLFSRGGIIIWVANIALCIFVTQRIKEIEVQKKKRMPFGSDLTLGPYQLNSPYEAFDTGTYEKSRIHLRPHTPPPDYEAYNGYRRQQGRRPSYPSESETLPVSLRSTSTGGHPRPPSSVRDSFPYPYDDTVELQHRASIAAENHYHSFAYENKALETYDTTKDNGTINIPRPKLRNIR